MDRIDNLLKRAMRYLSWSQLTGLQCIWVSGEIEMRPREFAIVLAAIMTCHPTDGQAYSDIAHGDPIKMLASLEPIDAHAHIYMDDPSVTEMLSRFNMHFLDILVIDDRDSYFKELEPQFGQAMSVVRSNKARVSLCTTFSPYDFEDSGFHRRVIRQLDEDFDRGAVAVKIYKTIGMEIKTKDGRYLMPDDPVFDPIYDEIEARNRTVVAHLAEPTSCWQSPNLGSPDYSYYKDNPQEYAYLHPGWPSKEQILRARDHVLERHPNLRVVGAHLGSLEVNVDDMAKRFDRYPNFAVDTAARIDYFKLQSRKKVRAFLIKYQDRVLYGTDLASAPGTDPAAAMKGAERMYASDWRYFATDALIEFHGRKIRGLGLPPSVLRRLYHDNAVRWFPGILSAANEKPPAP